MQGIFRQGEGKVSSPEKVKFIENDVGIFLVVNSEICYYCCVFCLFGVIVFLLLLMEFTGSRCQMNE